jgi:hypothetical protein
MATAPNSSVQEGIRRAETRKAQIWNRHLSKCRICLDKALARDLLEAERGRNHSEGDLLALVVIRLLIASAMPYQNLISPVSIEPVQGRKFRWTKSRSKRRAR